MSEFLSWVTIHLGRLAVYLRSASARLLRDRELRKQIDEVIETGISDFCSRQALPSTLPTISTPGRHSPDAIDYISANAAYAE